ncbi:polysaccharide deacetylase family protein [Solilutibacter silvestris]|uniref:Polysaccharide deacetylase n=1 Tax=Solilutibacter silvestris TaxID=1645665 RepID=A0A2K1PZC9_9GAMM|nr:polysaccharide deacetylase family protein [Lysobacter silvestris]PNS08145.1 Polysaccharide deacetylase [Lysobacter silvestris]
MRRMHLMYHGIHDGTSSPGHFDPVYSITRQRFARQLDWIANREHPNLFHITFDDGDVSNVTAALPMLVERGLHATFFITSGFIDRPGMLRRSNVRALADAGMHIGAHGMSHGFLEDMDVETLRRELHDSKAVLEDITGNAVDAMALPGGRGGARELDEALACGYRDLYGSRPGPDEDDPQPRWRNRIAITRELGDAKFAALANWSGPAAHWARLRHGALAVPKRMLGNARYQRLRAALT